MPKTIPDLQTILQGVRPTGLTDEHAAEIEGLIDRLTDLGLSVAVTVGAGTCTWHMADGDPKTLILISRTLAADCVAKACECPERTKRRAARQVLA